jgi:E3 ubiquitin-protein ligase HECTD2
MSDFYSSVVDSIDLVEDFTGWERRAQRFSFCQYPFLMSIWAKTQILEYDTRRQMEGYAREAFFNEIMNGRQANRFLALSVRRDCLVEDSLKAVGESLGSATDDAKKPLRVQFKGEEGIDGGGLRKEWFLLLVREVFSPDMGK